MNVSICLKNDTNMQSYSPHIHDEYEIILNLCGQCTTVIDNTEYNIEKGDIIIIPPGIVHEAYSDTGFSDIYIQAKHLEFDSVCITKDYNGDVLLLMNMLNNVLIEKEIKYKQIADNLLGTICSYIDKYINANYKYPFVKFLKNTIIENFTDPNFNLADAIKNTGYNKDYLRRCFEHDVGKTPLEFLINLRISRAKMFLIQSDFSSVRNIVEQCGFFDSLYFSTVFKKHTGISPMQYRKKKLKEEYT